MAKKVTFGVQENLKFGSHSNRVFPRTPANDLAINFHDELFR